MLKDGLTKARQGALETLAREPQESRVSSGRASTWTSGRAGRTWPAADIWTITATAAHHDVEPLSLLTDYLKACARSGRSVQLTAPLCSPPLDTEVPKNVTVPLLGVREENYVAPPDAGARRPW